MVMLGVMELAQLVKLDNFITRYSQDLVYYSNRFITLKKRRWEQMKYEWEWYKNQGQSGEYHHPIAKLSNEEKLRRYFENFIFQSQLKWASSTMSESSFLSKDYKEDSFLKELLIRCHDRNLLFYKPVVNIKKADFQLDTVMVGPYSVQIISYLQGENNSVFSGYNQRVWQEVTSHGTRQVISPLISIQRTYLFLKEMLQKYHIDLPIKSIIYTPISYIEYVDIPHYSTLIDRRLANDWFEEQRYQQMPFKHQQIKVAKTMLGLCKAGEVIT